VSSWQLHHRRLVWLGDVAQIDSSRAAIDSISVRPGVRDLTGTKLVDRGKASPSTTW
jgi:hypothetical protein